MSNLSIGSTPNAGQWWSRRWLNLVREWGIEPADGAGSRNYRVRRLEVLPGKISAAVQDRSLGSCSVDISATMLNDGQWLRVVESMGKQSMIAAQVLAGALPPELEQIFLDSGASLLPLQASEFSVSCSVCQSGDCRHLPVIYSMVGDLLKDDPGLLLLLRGRDRQQLMRDMRGARTVGAPTADSARQRQANASPVDAAVPVDALSGVSLAGEVAGFWGDRQLLKQFHHRIAPPQVELTLLRRLGPLSPNEDGMDVYEHLVALYRRVSEEALALAYATEEETA